MESYTNLKMTMENKSQAIKAAEMIAEIAAKRTPESPRGDVQKGVLMWWNQIKSGGMTEIFHQNRFLEPHQVRRPDVEGEIAWKPGK